MQHLLDAGTPNAFKLIRDPQPTKAMCDEVQEMNPKTLSACFLLKTRSRLFYLEIIYLDMMEVVMES